MKKYIYNPDVLLKMAQEYLSAEDEFHLFLRTHTTSYGYLDLSKKEDDRLYFIKEKESSCASFALRDACQLVGADMDTVLATAKSMNRYEKRERWMKSAVLPEFYDYDEHAWGCWSAIRFFAEPNPDADYFESTGRRKPWTKDKD